MYSVLEQHNGGSWWYHPGFTHDSYKEAEEHFEKSFWWDKSRPHRIIEHTKPFPQRTLCTFDFVSFGFGGVEEFVLE